MNILVKRTLPVVTAMLLCHGGAVTADDLWSTDIERRLAALETQSTAQESVQAAAYLSTAGAQCAGGSCGCRQCGACDACCVPCEGTYYGEAQLLWIRPHVSEDWIGKLSEAYDFSPRYVLGYEDCCGWGGRVRYWHYNDEINVLDPDTIGMQLNVWDLEATNHVHFARTDIVLAGGFRYADWELTCADRGVIDLDAYGLTMAVDARTLICAYGCNQWSFVYGGRLSILAGNWRGDNSIINTIVTPEVRDDNLLVPELYAGVEYGYRYCDCDLFLRATFEMQSWRSDVLSEPGIGDGLAPGSIGSANSIGFIGPGLHVGVRY